MLNQTDPVLLIGTILAVSGRAALALLELALYQVYTGVARKLCRTYSQTGTQLEVGCCVLALASLIQLTQTG